MTLNQRCTQYWGLPYYTLIRGEKEIEKQQCNIAMLNKWCWNIVDKQRKKKRRGEKGQNRKKRKQEERKKIKRQEAEAKRTRLEEKKNYLQNVRKERDE